jgi:predicted metalloprotease
MPWKGRRQSENVEDVRRSGGGKLEVGGGLGVVVLALVVYFLGGKPEQVMQVLQSQQGRVQEDPAASRELSPQEKEAGEFAAVILAETEDVWTPSSRSRG